MSAITDDDIFTALRSFLLVLFPSGVEIVQAQDNRVPFPTGPSITMNNAGQTRLATNTWTHDGMAQTATAMMPTQYTMQLDCYGPDSSVYASQICMMIRDGYAFDRFPADIKPLYAEDPIQIPLIDDEEQYVQRWRLMVVMQTNPSLTVSEQSATVLTIPPGGIVPVDVKF